MLQTRKLIKKNVFEKMEEVLKLGHTIPVTQKYTVIEGFGECAEETIKLEYGIYYKCVLDIDSKIDVEYKKTPIKKEQAKKMIKDTLNSLTIEELKEELEYYNDCLELYSEAKNNFVYGLK